MKGCTLTTRLNIKIVSVVFLLMITITAYTHWLSLQEENEKNIQYLMSITNVLLERKTENSFSKIYAQPDNDDQTNREEILALNRELQPLLCGIFIPTNTIKFGFYSQKYGNIVAIGPQVDKSLLMDVSPIPIQEFDESDAERVFEKEHSILWHGASTITYVQPIEENGVIVGKVFAAVNQDAVYAVIWKRTANTFLGAFIMLLICISIFRELFIRLKKDLQLFAESILSGNSYKYRSEIAEFTPILKYISQQTEQMTRLDRLNIIGEMAAGIAHEIRNPLTTVRGLLQLLTRKKEFHQQQENFSLMIDEIDRANSIITEFLSLAKNRTMNFEATNLNDIIQDIYPLIHADAVCNHCDIELHLNRLPKIPLDENSIRQLLFNMIRNALDAMPQNGLIHIMTKYKKSTVILLIRDSGSGIPADIKDKLGTPFFTTKENGTGLGLAICYRILQRHKATMEIESEPGKGTTFIMKFGLTLQ
ncbi:ATP-binding protein [Anaerosinus massiliensis]|uniref:ATP-binding protein n=1 Tax=Massilibacillus massiliensis TaxID=1806837 RepID=UPI000DA5EF2E|nr:ATP-binding protein [Massilibacillus massiliensis]